MSLTKIDLIERIRIEFDLSKDDSQDLLESLFSIMKDTLATGEEVKVSGFGKFEVKQKKARKGRNPATGEAMTIESRRILTYKPSSLLRSRING